jgi:peptide chain release factor subunit 1
MGYAVVAGTITWEQLRELARFRAQKGCAISVYVKLDPSETPTPRDVDARINSLLDEAGKLAEERKSSATHAQRQGVKADLERMRAFFEDGFDRDGARGFAVFAAGLDNFWSTLALPDPVLDEVRINSELCLAPLVPFVGRGDGILVGVVGRERGEVFHLEGGQLQEIADESEDVPGRHDQGGWSQARYERHIDTIVARHWQRVADTLDRCVREHVDVHVVLVGAEDIRSEFEDGLAHEIRSRVIGWTTVEAHAGPPEICQAVLPVVDAWWNGREDDVLDRWREHAAKNARASSGWEQTLEAASDGRIDLLLVQNGVDHPAYKCPQCGRAQLTDGSCPLDGTTLESREDGLDLAVHQTLAHGGTVQVIRDRRDLEPVGGVGALLRF